ncbi:hypothetical protein MTBSS4_110030 [Magnetospirillum sp. SS-4]|nr:hypothetical protein MTBSS4_110030 [Magnetospirillum sp. SS-4]
MTSYLFLEISCLMLPRLWAWGH